MRTFKTLLNWNGYKTALELYISLNSKAAECLSKIDNDDLANLDILWTALDNEFLQSHYVTTLLPKCRARKCHEGERMMDYHSELQHIYKKARHDLSRADISTEVVPS